MMMMMAKVIVVVPAALFQQRFERFDQLAVHLTVDV